MHPHVQIIPKQWVFRLFNAVETSKVTDHLHCYTGYLYHTPYLPVHCIYRKFPSDLR